MVLGYFGLNKLWVTKFLLHMPTPSCIKNQNYNKQLTQVFDKSMIGELHILKLKITWVYKTQVILEILYFLMGNTNWYP